MKYLIATLSLVALPAFATVNITGSVEAKCVIQTDKSGVYGNPIASKLSTTPADGGILPVIRIDVSIADAYTANITHPSNRAATETEGAIKFSRNSYSQNSDLIKVKFTINSSVIMYLCYDPYNDEHFPALNESFLLSTKTKYFPIALLRLGAIGTPTEWIGEISSYSDEVNAEQYRQTKRLLKYWGVNIESIIDNLKENPDIDDGSARS